MCPQETKVLAEMKSIMLLDHISGAGTNLMKLQRLKITIYRNVSGNSKNPAGNADRNIWRMSEYACKCYKNAKTRIFWNFLQQASILFAYVWYFSEFLTSAGILRSFFTYRNMQNGICMNFLPFSQISAVFQSILKLYVHTPEAFLHFENTFQRSSPCWGL